MKRCQVMHNMGQSLYGLHQCVRENTHSGDCAVKVFGQIALVSRLGYEVRKPVYLRRAA